MKFNPMIIINIGIAGATTKEIHTKDIVIGEECININSYRTPNLKEQEGSNPNDWQLLTFLSGEEDRFTVQSANQALISLVKDVSNLEQRKIHYGRIGSGDVWNREIDRILFLNKEYQILCEDMESIATYTIANQWNIPVISFKTISDNALTGEEYNREVGSVIQNYLLEYLDVLIKKIPEEKN